MAGVRERVSAAIKAFQEPRKKIPVGIERSVSGLTNIFNGFWTSPYNPSDLISRKGMKIFDRMLLDDQVKAAVKFKRHAVTSTGWEVISPESMPEDWEPTKLVKWNFENFQNIDSGQMGGTIADVAIDMLSAFSYGFSVTEKIWSIANTGDHTGKIVYGSLKTRRPHEFTFDTDEFGNLLPNGIIQRQSKGNEKLPRDKFIVYIYGHEFQNWYGQSDLEAAYRPWWIKENSYKWLAMLLERLGVPPIFFLYDGNYTPQQVDNLKKIAQNLQAATSGAIPRPTPESLDFWSPELANQATQVFIPSIKMLDSSIARSILMPGNLGVTPDEATGSFARAKKIFDLFILVVEQARSDMERIINRQAIKPLCDLNFGGITDYPRFRWMPLMDEERFQLFDSWVKAVDARIVVKQPEDEIHIRNILKFPTKSPEAPEVGFEPPVPQALPGSPPTAGGGPPQFGPVEFSYSVRRPNKIESVVNFQQIAKDLDSIEISVTKRLRAILTETREALVGTVRKEKFTNPRDINDLRLKGMGDIQDAMREFLRNTFGIGDKTLRGELPRKFQERGPSFIPTEALRWLNEKARISSAIIRDDIANKAKLVLMNGLKFGEPQRETIGKLEELFEPYVGDDDIIRDDDVISPRRLETTVRTNATEAFNQGRLITARDPDIRELMLGMEYSAVIDSRTTEVCRFLDEKIFEMADSNMDRLTPPNHFNCRSLLVPVTVGTQVDEGRFITRSQAGRAMELAQGNFV